jgi:putative ABC transport system permease protein
MLGMIIGVGAVITMVALGRGAQATIEEQIRGAGTNMVTIFPGNPMPAGGVRLGEGMSARLMPADAEALRALPDVAYVAESVTSRQQLIASNQNTNSSIVGTNVDYLQIKSWPMKYGAFFTEQDVQSAAKVIALGVNVAELLYGPDVDPTGETLRVRNHVVKVIGVMGPKGASSSGQNQDEQVFMPYTTVQKKLLGQQHLNYIVAAAATGDRIPQTVTAITELLRVRHDIGPGQEDDFRTQTLDDMVAMRTQTTSTLTSLLAAIAGVSLLVGGIGIMNIMLVSVTERTREIGLRMAIGAKSRDVLLQFLVEAITLSLLGGTIGIALGFGLAEGIQRWMAWPAKVPPGAVAMAFGFAAATGVFFGFYPAQKAARLNPIDALRFE